jgi:hypothetical protein
MKQFTWVFIFFSLGAFAECPKLEGEYLCGKIGRERDDLGKIVEIPQSDGTTFFQVIIADHDGEEEVIEAFSGGKKHKFKRKFKGIKIKGKSWGHCKANSLNIHLRVSAFLLKATASYKLEIKDKELFIFGKTSFLGSEDTDEIGCHKL